MAYRGTNEALSDSEVRKAGESAVGWMKSVRNKDYGWSYVEGRLSLPVETAEVVLAHMDWGISADSPYLKPSVDYVLNWLRSLSSGTEDIEGVTITPRNLAWILLLVTNATNEKTLENSFKSTLERFWVKGRGWVMVKEEGDRCNVFDTAMSIIYLTQRGDTKVDEPLSWLHSVQGSDGGLGFHEGESGAVICTAASVLAASNKGSENKEFIKRCVKWLLSSRERSGGWKNDYEALPYPSAEGEAHYWTHFATPWAIMALVVAGHRGDEVDGAVRYLLSIQTRKGGWLGREDVSELTFSTSQSLSSLAVCLGKPLISLKV